MTLQKFSKPFEHLETPDCLICNSTEKKPFYQVSNRFNQKESFDLVKCPNCNFVYLSPRPTADAIGVYYEVEEYQPHQANARNAADVLYQRVRIWNNRYKRKTIEKYKKNGNILDYGCGTGEFLLEMNVSGWKTYGYEPLTKAANIARNHGLNILKSLQNYQGGADIITLWHVLEHIHDARGIIKTLQQIMAPEAYLIIAVPNYQSFDAKIFKQNWVAFDAPRHLYHFTPETMTLFLESMNFQIVSYKTLYFDPWYNSLLSAKIEAKNKKFKLLIQSLSKSLIAATIANLQSFFIKKRSSSLIYIAQSIK
jgi:2-polyprenyl-3-methyl-5-hydroxy-6-metoxy-1,4-benzoquinol methylase